MKTWRLDITHSMEFLAENHWAADRIRRAIEEAQAQSATRSVEDLKISVVHRRLGEFYCPNMRFMPVPLRDRGDGNRKSALFGLLRMTLLALAILEMYYGWAFHPMVFGAGAMLAAYWLVDAVATEVLNRLPMGETDGPVTDG